MYFTTPRFPLLKTVVASLAVVQSCALQVDPTNADSIKSAAKSIANDMMAYYVGDQPGQTPGYLPGNGDPVNGYYWWEGGGMFAAMINYWYHTGDTTWVDATSQAIWFQADPGSGGYFQSTNISLQLGNDDQAFWAFAAMMAAEYKFPNPPAGYPSWLGMAQGVYNQQIQRWDNTTCGGGLRWQVTGSGGPYKNSISNGCFFQLAARVGKYTGNTTQIDAANMAWDWSVAAGLITFYDSSNTTYKVIDGIDISTCKPDSGNHFTQWTYNVGVYLYGAAVMWNITQNNAQYASQADVWQQRATAMLSGMQVFLRNDTQGTQVVTEVVCEPDNICKNDAKSFKSYAIQWMRVSAIVAPFLADQVSTMLSASVGAAATACTGPGQAGGAACGMKWYVGDYDGITGIGQQMNALEVIQTLIPTNGPLIAAQGNSSSDPGAGTNSGYYQPNDKVDTGIIHVTTADRVGAWIIFTLLAGGTLGGSAWACM